MLRFAASASTLLIASLLAQGCTVVEEPPPDRGPPPVVVPAEDDPAPAPEPEPAPPPEAPPLLVVEAPTGKVVLNHGEDAGVPVGVEYDVFRTMAQAVDRRTGQRVGGAESNVARIKIVDVQPNYSVGEVLGGHPRRGDVCRLAAGPSQFAPVAKPPPPPPPAPGPDTEAPLIRVVSPRQGESFEAAPVVIVAEVSDDRSVARVTVNDAVVAQGAGRFRAKMREPLDGLNQVVIEAWDGSGNKAQEVVNFVFKAPPPPDDVDPVIEVLAPQPGQKLSASPVHVVVKVSDDTAVARVRINGLDAEHDAKGRYRIALHELTSGENTIRVLASDTAGNMASTQWAFLFDATPPEVEAEAWLLVEGTVDDVDAKLTINGVDVEFDPNTGRYAARVPPDPKSPGRVTIVATDAFGNQTVEVRQVR